MPFRVSVLNVPVEVSVLNVLLGVFVLNVLLGVSVLAWLCCGWDSVSGTSHSAFHRVRGWRWTDNFPHHHRTCLFGFVYTPRHGWDVASILRTEPFIGNTIRRHCWWYKNIVWIEDMKVPSLVILSENDQVSFAASGRSFVPCLSPLLCAFSVSDLLCHLYLRASQVICSKVASG